jgi:hypothetical protein
MIAVRVRSSPSTAAIELQARPAGKLKERRSVSLNKRIVCSGISDLPAMRHDKCLMIDEKHDRPSGCVTGMVGRQVEEQPGVPGAR